MFCFDLPSNPLEWTAILREGLSHSVMFLTEELFFRVEFFSSLHFSLDAVMTCASFLLAHSSAVCGPLLALSGLARLPPGVSPNRLLPPAQVPFLQPPNPSPSPASFREGSPLISMTTVAPCQLVCAVCKCRGFLCPSKSACRLPVADSSLFKETVLTVPSWV